MTAVLESKGPRELVLHGIRLWDVRERYPIDPAKRFHRVVPSQVDQAVIHHDGVLFQEGDRNYNGTTVDEAIARIDADVRYAWTQGWNRPPYDFMIDPNEGRIFYVKDMTMIGCHVNKANTRSIGISIIGNYMERLPTDQAICGAGGALVVATREVRPPGYVLSYLPHFEVPKNNTDCPGATYYQWGAKLWNAFYVQATR